MQNHLQNQDFHSYTTVKNVRKTDLKQFQPPVSVVIEPSLENFYMMQKETPNHTLVTELLNTDAFSKRGELEFKCPTCLFVTPTRLSHLTHFKLHLKAICYSCFAWFETDEELASHKQTTHSEDSGIVEMNSFMFGSDESEEYSIVYEDESTIQETTEEEEQSQLSNFVQLPSVVKTTPNFRPIELSEIECLPQTSTPFRQIARNTNPDRFQLASSIKVPTAVCAGNPYVLNPTLRTPNTTTTSKMTPKPKKKRRNSATYKSNQKMSTGDDDPRKTVMSRFGRSISMRVPQF